MSLHLQRDLVQIKKEILQLGNMVEVAINNAILSLIDRRPDLAESVLKKERLINKKEVKIEENCLKILALHQPVAVDLRFIVVILKVNNDLERMGDFAVNAAKRAISLSEQDPIPYPPEFTNTMSKGIIKMVHDSLDALVKLDVDIARKVIAMDDEIDAVNRLMYVELQSLMEKDSTTVKRGIELLSTSRYLERIADLATNIAEEIIFIVEGEVVRHH
ncbi:MAG: phosphate transport system protein [Candidatus Azotimanducaceae bacterium]|jgi:phosphate transport system protein